jgi:hypothetical protein
LENQSLESLHLLKIKCKDTEIYDFIWHPLSNLTIVALVSNDCLEIWNLNDEDFLKPSQIINLRLLTNSNHITNADSKFRRLSMINDDIKMEREQSKVKYNANCNKYTLFLMNFLGGIVSVYPFLPIGTFLTSS